MEGASLQEWKIENFSCFSEDVHGKYIQSPPFFHSFFTKIKLYPKRGSEHMIVHFCIDPNYRFSGDVSFIASDGSLIHTLHVDNDQSKPFLFKGPTFRQVVDIIKKNEAEDQLTLRSCYTNGNGIEQSMCTNIDVLKVSFAIDQEFVADVGIRRYKSLSFIPYTHDKDHEGLHFKASEKSKRVHFTLEAENWNHNSKAILVESYTNVLREDGSLVRCEKKNHVFNRKKLWTFSDSIPVSVNGTNLAISIKIVNGNVKNSYNNILYGWKGVRTVPNDSVCSHDELKNINASKLEDPLAVLSRELMSLYKDQDFSDFELICGKVTFPVHKNILSARSPVFRRMFSIHMKEAASGSLVIEDLDAPSLARFLVFLYSGTVEDLPWDSAIQLYSTADKYQVPTLKKRCVEVLVSDVSVQNVCHLLSLAHTNADSELTWVAQDFILNHFTEVSRSEGWQSYMKTDPSLLLETVTYFAAKGYVLSSTIKDEYEKPPKIAKRM